MLQRAIVSVTLLTAALVAAGCATAPKTPAALSPEGADVAVAVDTPSPRLARPLGGLVVAAEGKDALTAERAAENELRNRAAKMGATLVKIDDSIGQKVLLSDDTRVTLVARAYKGD